MPGLSHNDAGGPPGPATGAEAVFPRRMINDIGRVWPVLSPPPAI